ncbi:MAG: cell division protein FtsQ/DivIB [Buchnera aphidicola (Kaburagia rhusicola ensigallis)]
MSKRIPVLLKYTIILSLIVFIILSSFIIIKLSKQWYKKKLSHFIISGQFSYLNRKEIKDFILSLKTSCDFFSPCNFFIKNKLQEFTFTQKIKVQKQWPDKLLIYIVSTIPVAYWNNEYILDKKEIIFHIIKKKQNIKNIPYFYGPQNSEKEILKNYDKVKNVLKKNKIVLRSITITPYHSWKLVIENNIEIALGKINNIIQLKRLMMIWKTLKYEEKIKRKKIKYIDLRYESGIAIAWK